jgi:aspartate kinase
MLQEIIVVKFGGSVLENEKAISQAAALVRTTQQRGIGIAVVVSAMKGVTDNLLSLSKKVNPEITPSMLDDILALGEKTSTRFVAAALSAHGLKPVIVDPESRFWPIITDKNHLDANPLMEESRKRVQELILPLIREGKTPVLCGFVGKTVNGETTTLGRGGSDTTAVVLGNCLEAKEVVLIKDVEGVFSSDPDKVSNPQLIDTLDGEEAELLAMGGAKFLHAKALRYKSSESRIRVTSLDKLDSGTIIKGEFPEIHVEVYPAKVIMITIVGLDLSKMHPIVKVVEAINRAGGTLLSLSLESGSALLYVAGGQNVLDVVHQALIGQGIGKALSLFEGLSMITIKGSTLETETGLIQRITQPLARSGINLFGIVTITSSVRVFVAANQAEKAAQLINSAMMVTAQ